MAHSLNKVMLIGNLGDAPTIKKFENGDSLASFSVATGESWKDKKTGEKKEKVYWHRVVVKIEGLVGVCEKYLLKGSKVYIEGAHQERTYKDKEGIDKSISEIVVGFNGSIKLLGDPRTLTEIAKSTNTINNDFDDEVPF